MNKYLITICLLPFLFGSCSDFLDKEPKNILSDATVWESPEAIEAYMGKMYDRMPVEDFNFVVIDQAGFTSELTDEAVRGYIWGGINNPIIPDGSFPWWGYGEMREVNTFLQKIKDAPLTEEQKTLYEAEARFIRAFYYFGMVKRYGGVPLLTEAQEYTGGNMEDLQVPRNTEKEIWDFIRTEIDEITPLLPEAWDTSNRFRATKYAALALKSRAMLYAASVATYSTVQLDGLLGIPESEKDFYWNESKKASEEIMNSGQFALYEMYDNKEENFQQLFLDESLHSEAIFVKAFTAPDKGHNYDYYNAPQTFKIDWGCVINPVVELLEAFDYVDGTSGELRVNDAEGNPIEYSNPTDLFKDKDPRLMASIMVPFSEWMDGQIEVRKGIIDNGQLITASNMTDTYGEGENQITIIGKDGILDMGDPTKTGLYVKKFMNPTEIVNAGRSEVNWMVFRYAEILLNYAEACMELGQDTDRALEAINEIRRRAGVAELSNLSLELVRKERRVELAFENHRWWDLRRWHISHQVLNNAIFHALNPYLVWEEGKHPSEMKYIFKIEPAPKGPKTFLPKLYYEKIASSQIQTNPLIIQNPGY